ncbi:MAG: 7,8-didemethyl-8-hydroxy-5-deazariboflavin synthase subunit CofG [Acidimicrobiia bacterium]|nr:7,8-didemethyl-8-hydroxy-5-deazariboflavin synthase subunit CofG [Acidimicrobiia bacterium]
MDYRPPTPRQAVEYIDGKRDFRPLFKHAGHLRDEGRGRTITFSPKVFIPLTTLCRDVCTYCTFAKPPGGGGQYLRPEDVVAIAEAGDAAGCREALLTLGDRPEERWSQARDFLNEQGHSTTIDYVQEMSELIVDRTGLFPHANPGNMTAREMEGLRPSNVSMGMMLENISPRLMEPGMPHYNCPDKDPALRMQTIENAGVVRVPFTTGLLVGIGENSREIVDSLFAIREVHRRWGHIQEVIIQNFRAKADTRMRRSAEPIPQWFARVVAVARWILGPQVNLQVPPNLTERYEIYLEAGINDWGGVSPLTIDWVNPEAPWPHLEELKARTEAGGFELAPRLPVYPDFISNRWIDPGLIDRVHAATDDRGYARRVSKEASV